MFAYCYATGQIEWCKTWRWSREMGEMIERVARAIVQAEEQNGGPPWDMHAGSKHVMEMRMDRARAAIEAMRGAGKLVAGAMHERAGRAGWPTEYECQCFDAVLDAALQETHALNESNVSAPKPEARGASYPPSDSKPALEPVSAKELADLRSAKLALPIEQRKHAKARRRVHELEREIERLRHDIERSIANHSADLRRPLSSAPSGEVVEAAREMLRLHEAYEASATSGDEPSPEALAYAEIAYTKGPILARSLLQQTEGEKR